MESYFNVTEFDEVFNEFYKITAKSIDKSLYHYTNISSLEGILSSKVLRASNMFFLSDPSEGNEGIDKSIETIFKMIRCLDLPTNTLRQFIERT